MPKAWLTYDPETRIPIEVSWAKVSVDSLAIPLDLAEKFVLGEARMTDYRISEDGSRIDPVSIGNFSPPPVFWELTTIDDESIPFEITINEQSVVVRPTTTEMLPDTTLFATLKNDPSWLIHTWHLYETDLINGIIEIMCPDAYDYSFYMGRLNET